MKAALLPDRGVVKVAGHDARNFLHGLLSADILKLEPGAARFSALLSPQGKIIADFIVAEAPVQEGGGFFIDISRALAKPLVDKLNLYKLRSRVIAEDLSEVLGVLAAWDGHGATAFGLSYADPRLPALGLRVVSAGDFQKSWNGIAFVVHVQPAGLRPAIFNSAAEWEGWADAHPLAAATVIQPLTPFLRDLRVIYQIEPNQILSSPF